MSSVLLGNSKLCPLKVEQNHVHIQSLHNLIMVPRYGIIVHSVSYTPWPYNTMYAFRLACLQTPFSFGNHYETLIYS
jgi:hypothetical protein